MVKIGLKKSIGKFLGVAALGVSVYTAGIMTSDSAKNAVFYAVHPKTQIEAGYCNIDEWQKEKRINSSGNIEHYLINKDGSGLPCLEGQVSIQLGNDNYVIGNLRVETKADAIESGYNSLPEEQRLEIVVGSYNQLSPQNQNVLADKLMSINHQNKWEYFKRTVTGWWDGIIKTDKYPGDFWNKAFGITPEDQKEWRKRHGFEE